MPEFAASHVAATADGFDEILVGIRTVDLRPAGR
jgi:hypothetical protein